MTGNGRIRSSDSHTVDFGNVHQKYVSYVQISQMYQLSVVAAELHYHTNKILYFNKY